MTAPDSNDRLPAPTAEAEVEDLTGLDLSTLLLDESQRVPAMDNSRRVFVNRNLRLDKIDVIGFDMDYTLAIYKKTSIEQLAFDKTVEKLLAGGYPEGILEATRYEPDRIMRGLVVDKEHGNVFKMDRYGHVGRVYHGLTELTKDARTALYRHRKIDPGEEGYEWIDTLFSLPEICLYAQLVHWFDEHPEGAPSYPQIAADIRNAIDLAHADGSLKDVIKQDPASYVEKSPELALALHRFRSSGKRLFVLTNSYWPYTDALMSYLLDGVLEGYPSWRRYFDLVIVAAKKPSFFSDRTPFYPVDDTTDRTSEVPATSLEKGRVYQHGNLPDLERMGKFGGEGVLYVGDHIYGDILFSKKSSLWRTCMIVPELEDVVWHEDLYAADLGRLAAIDDETQRADYGINYYKLLLNRIAKLKEDDGTSELERARLEEVSGTTREALDRLRVHLKTQIRQRDDWADRIDRSYNRYWGRLFVEGSETSLFGQQVENFAGLYTSRVSNFAHYSPVQYFRSLAERLPHERYRH